MNVRDMHELNLALKHRTALAHEDYEACQLIKSEIDRRISENTIDHNLMNAFKFWDKDKGKFTGEPNFSQYNGLFDNYVYPSEKPQTV